MKTICIIIFSILLFSTTLSGQVTGDFQTKNITGNWSDFNAWNIYNGSAWIPAVGGQIPLTTSNVFIQNGHTINADITTAVCNDLNFTASGTTLKVIIQAARILTIYGNLNQAATTNDPFPSFGANAKIIFAGSSNQIITNSSASTNLNTVEINKSGGTFTLPAATTKFDVFTLTAGALTGAAGSNLQGNSTAAIVNVNGGTWTQNSSGANRINGGAAGANCTLNINSGTMTLSTTSSLGYNFSSVTITNGGILNLNNDIASINVTTLFSIDATSALNTAMGTTPSASTMNFSGTVNYNHTAAQNIINTLYGNLGLSGGGSKTPSANLNINKNITISGAAILPLGSFSASIGGNWANYATGGFTESASTVDFNGSGTQLINTTGGEDFFKLTKSGTGTLTLNADVKLAGTSSELNISAGILDAGIYTLSGTASAALVMSGGVLKLAKLSTAVPEFLIPAYSLTGGTIELYGAGTQILRGGKDYRNLTFSGSTSASLGSNPNSITGTVYITGAALVDIGTSNGFGGVSTNLTMDGGRLKMAGSSGAKPDIDGTYSLSAGVIEFAGSNAAPQPIKGKSNAGSVIYKTIEITGINVGTSNDNIYLQAAAGSLTVKSGATFSISLPTIKSSNDVVNTSTLTVENNAVFKTGNNRGFSGDTEGFGHNSSIHSNIAAANIFLMTGSTVDYISSGAQNISNQVPYHHFIISSASGTKTAPSGTLTIQGNFTKTGASSFAHNNGTVIFNNTIISQDYNCTSAAPVNFYNLTNSNIPAFNIINNLGIENTLTATANSKLNLASGDISLLSSATNTARVAEIPLTAAITYGASSGRFNVERYFPNSNPVSHRAWRLVTSPLNETQTIFDSWQLSGAIYGPANYNRGTLITGPQIAGNGLDFTSTNNYSLKKYDGTNFISVTNTNVSLSPAIGTGYLLFVRGDRNPILTNVANSSVTTLSSRGKLQTGQLTLDASNGYNCIGNPYASPVNFDLIDKSNNVNPHRFYIFDPSINLVGAYVVMEDYATPHSFVPTIPYASSSQDNFIQSSQAFFVVKENPGSASITFHESDKASNYNPAVFRPAAPADRNIDFVRSNLYIINTNGSRTIADGNLVEFGNAYSDSIDAADAIKFSNINENFFILRNGQKLAVERRNRVSEMDTVFYQLLRNSLHKYQFEIVINIKSKNLTGYLEDSYTKKSTQMNLSGINLINFEVNGDLASAAASRFRFVFKNTRAQLPFIFKDIKVTKQNRIAILEWSVENEADVKNYKIEKSLDGLSFDNADSINTTGKNKYKWQDAAAAGGDNFYRIKMTAIDGTIVYSKVVTINLVQITGAIEIFPNPYTTGAIKVHLLNQAPGIYTIELINSLGAAIKLETVTHNGVTASIKLVSDNCKLVPGLYGVKIIKPDASVVNLKLMVGQ
jgi:hypothetical protein